ncbi:hypothetical protein AB0I60_12595 [Actinosynnema sp. NPDC050436]|uniref:hypothetical protein n=1 Tax=Actinosynnema sp. NPDC050436 TaxID=3155659 RepID=UPI0033FBAA14
MRAAGRTGRFGLVLAALLMLLGIASGTASGQAGGHAAPPAGGSASSAPSMHDDRHDWLRVSLAVRHSPAEAQPDTWWAVCPWARGGPPERRWSLPAGPCSSARTATAPVPWSSRAPPVA